VPDGISTCCRLFYHAFFGLQCKSFLNSEKPMGVAEYQLVRTLLQPLDTCLPSIEEIEAALSD